MELAECGAFRADVTFPPVSLRYTRATKLTNLQIIITQYPISACIALNLIAQATGVSLAQLDKL